MKRFVEDVKRGRVGRRELLRAMAGLGIAVVALPLARPARSAQNDIVYFTWEGYDAPELHPRYIDKYGASPQSAIFATEDEALLKMRAGFQATLGHPSSYAVGRWYNAGILQPIEVGRLSNYPDLWPELKTVPGVVQDGKPYLVPFDWGNSSILYRTDVVEPGEESWNLLFDERYAGRLATYSDAAPCVEVAGLALGYKNVFSMDETQLAAVGQLLTKQKSLLRFYWDSQTSMEQAVASGEVVAAYSWNSSYASLKKAGLPVAYANPREGMLTWVAGLALFKNPVGSLDAAYDFIDAMLDPEVGKYMIETWGYGHSNRKSFEIADPTITADLGIRNPTEIFSRGVFFEPVPDALADRYVQVFQDATL